MNIYSYHISTSPSVSMLSQIPISLSTFALCMYKKTSTDLTPSLLSNKDDHYIYYSALRPLINILKSPPISGCRDICQPFLDL